MVLVRRTPRSRSIFSLASSSQTFSESKVLPYPKKKLFDVVANVSSYPQFVPFCTGSRILTTSERKGMTPFQMDAELTVGFLSFNESYISRVSCVPYSSVEAVASSSTPLFDTLSTIWRFKPAEQNEDTTLVTLDLSFAFASPIHAAVSSAFFGQVSKQMVQAFQDRCSEVYSNGNHYSFLSGKPFVISSASTSRVWGRGANHCHHTLS
ncbi:hypothetical protein D9757_000060 [Collybiopsis confluens]|uniref:Coenzyme Q-binding protein COQ10 START domain-containing protein n=1 Tax=Collybiopsis confluens TaxID=2823264 RepID=A0A8H5I230_9AGAR|nr:hypothetical protein D9757_000060 [Collybiopsis confluens]